VFGAPSLAQSTQGQFTPDADAPIQLHMPVHLHPRATHRAAPKPKAKTATEAAASAAPPETTQAAPIPFGSDTASPAAAPSPPPARQATASRPRDIKAARNTVASLPPPASRAERRKAVQEVLSGSASAIPSSGTAADVTAPGAAIPFSFDAATIPEAISKNQAPARPAPRGNRSSSAPAHPRTSVAALEPPKAEAPAPKPKTDPHAGLTKQGEILFAASSTDPEADGAGQVKSIAGNLNAALDSDNARVELEAFGGPPGDKSSDARRLSLRRALAIRQLLIDGGIPADRIDVKALGGIDDQGKADRVDVWLRGAS